MWCRFLGSTQPLLPAVSAFLPLSMEITTYLLASAVVRDHIHSIVFFKPTVSIRPPVPPSGSQKLSASDSAFWPTLCTLKDFTYLLTYLLRAFVLASRTGRRCCRSNVSHMSVVYSSVMTARLQRTVLSTAGQRSAKSASPTPSLTPFQMSFCCHVSFSSEHSQSLTFSRRFVLRHTFPLR